MGTVRFRRNKLNESLTQSKDLKEWMIMCLENLCNTEDITLENIAHAIADEYKNEYLDFGYSKGIDGTITMGTNKELVRIYIGHGMHPNERDIKAHLIAEHPVAQSIIRGVYIVKSLYNEIKNKTYPEQNEIIKDLRKNIKNNKPDESIEIKKYIEKELTNIELSIDELVQLGKLKNAQKLDIRYAIDVIRKKLQ